MKKEWKKKLYILCGVLLIALAVWGIFKERGWLRIISLILIGIYALLNGLSNDEET